MGASPPSASVRLPPPLGSIRALSRPRLSSGWQVRNLYFSRELTRRDPAGTWQSQPGEVEHAVEVALKNGYRHVDGAFVYKNEKEVGEGLKASGVPRSDVFLTSKLCVAFLPVSLEPLCAATGAFVSAALPCSLPVTLADPRACFTAGAPTIATSKRPSSGPWTTLAPTTSTSVRAVSSLHSRLRNRTDLSKWPHRPDSLAGPAQPERQRPAVPAQGGRHQGPRASPGPQPLELFLEGLPTLFADFRARPQDTEWSINDTWRQMEAVLEKGLVKAIGVSK